MRKYDIYLDYKGYMISPRTYRVTPAPLFGTRFTTGRPAYSGMDFWQTSAMTDFSKGIGQKFLVDPSSYKLSLGIDPSQPGEIKLERDLTALTAPSYPTGIGEVTASYRARLKFYLGTDSGKIIGSADGIDFSDEEAPGTGQIYNFFEMAGHVWASRGPGALLKEIDGTWYELKEHITGTALFTKDSVDVVGIGSAWDDSMIGRKIKNNTNGIWYKIDSVTDTLNLKLTETYAGDTTVSEAYTIAGITGLYFVMIESDYAFGYFWDGIRRSIDGLEWTPEPPDPLWVMPESEGLPLNAITIPRGFFIGSERGIWVFLGGVSGINIHTFPDYADPNNFKGMDKWGSYAIFSVEGLGIFYSGGTRIYPTNINRLNEAMPFKSCRGLTVSGFDVYAIVKNEKKVKDIKTGAGIFRKEGKDVKTGATISVWYLVRANLNYYTAPKHFWIVKRLSKVPCFISSYKSKVFVHYEDGTVEYVDSTKYQTSGYLETSIIDQDLIKLQKFYRSISAMSEPLTPSTSFKINCFLNNAWLSGKTVSEVGKTQGEYILPNPSLDNKISLKVTLQTDDITETPVLTDLCWTYFLETPEGQAKAKKMFYFLVLAEERLEKRDREVSEDATAIRTPEQIVSGLWASKQKKEILNFIGAGNVESPGMKVEHVGEGDSCVMTIDRTNYEINIYVDDVLDQTIDYQDQTISELVAVIDALEDYTAVLQAEAEATAEANDLMPIKEQEIKGGEVFQLGSDVHAVIWTQRSPSEMRLSLTSLASARMNVSLREA